MGFKCRYSSNIQTSSSKFAVDTANASGEVLVQGNLAEGFKIGLFPSSEFKTESAHFFMGEFVFVDVTWSVTSATSVIEFIVYDCYVSTNGAKIDIIDNSCYSETLSAKKLDSQASKIVDSTSRFQYKVFIGGEGAGTDSGQELTCEIKMCVKAEGSCAKLDSGTAVNDVCPDRPDYKFVRNG